MGRYWTQEGEDILRQYYSSHGAKWCKLALKEIEIERTPKQIMDKAMNMGIRRNKRSIPQQRKAIVYTLPECVRCEILKGFLHTNDIKFEQRRFDVAIQAEFIMENEFGDPPILLIRGQWATSKDLFDEYKLQELEAHKFINKVRGTAFPSAYATHKYCKKCGEWIWRPLAGERCDICGSLYSDGSRRKRK